MEFLQADLDALRRFSQLMEAEGAEIEHISLKTRRLLDDLMETGWIGRGANQFHDEMFEIALPALSRLSAALNDTALQMIHVAMIYQQAQETAATQITQVSFHS